VRRLFFGVKSCLLKLKARGRLHLATLLFVLLLLLLLHLLLHRRRIRLRLSSVLELARLWLDPLLELRLLESVLKSGLGLLQLHLNPVNFLVKLIAELVEIAQLLLGVGFVLANLLQLLCVLLFRLLQLADNLLHLLDMLFCGKLGVHACFTPLLSLLKGCPTIKKILMVIFVLIDNNKPFLTQSRIYNHAGEIFKIR